MILYSPAKVNLTFSLLGKRTDGYHEIETRMQTIDWMDMMRIEASDEDQWSSTDPALRWDPSNLVFAATSLFRKKTGKNAPVRITLQKEIPIGAGLGGGSSNAATTLWGLNQLFHTHIPDGTLLEWSMELGSDVPFFFSLGAALSSGKGEKIAACSPERQEPFWIAMPPFSLSTPEVYKAVTQEDFGSDLEKAACRIQPALARFKEGLLEDFSEVKMSGSGSSFVCYGKKKQTVSVRECRWIQRTQEKWYTP